jgi:hypothetical protein
VNFCNKIIFYGEELLAPRPTPQAGGPPLVGYPRLLIQYIRSYPPYLEAVPSIRNLRTCHALVTRDPPNMGLNFVRILYSLNSEKYYSRNISVPGHLCLNLLFMHLAFHTSRPAGPNGGGRGGGCLHDLVVNRKGKVCICFNVSSQYFL